MWMMAHCAFDSSFHSCWVVQMRPIFIMHIVVNNAISEMSLQGRNESWIICKCFMLKANMLVLDGLSC